MPTVVTEEYARNHTASMPEDGAAGDVPGDIL
jgi:hypothetical protein